MSAALFGLPHIAQLHEIQKARLKKGAPGIGTEVQELISRLTDGGVAYIDSDLADVRRVQAKAYWNLGLGRELGIKGFKAYLESIPAAPEVGLSNRTGLHPHLLLVEPRIVFAKLCELVGIEWCQTWVKDLDGNAPTDRAPFWVAYADGALRRGMKIARHIELQGKVVDDRGFTAFIAACAYAQNRNIVREGTGDWYDPYYMQLVGTRHKKYGCANLITAPGGAPQIRDGQDGCAVYGIPSYVRL